MGLTGVTTCVATAPSVVDQAALPEVIFAAGTKPATAAGAGAGAGESKASANGVEYGSPTKRLQSVAERIAAIEAARARVRGEQRPRDDASDSGSGDGGSGGDAEGGGVGGGDEQPGPARLRDVALVIAADGVEAQARAVEAGKAQVESPTLVRGSVRA